MRIDVVGRHLEVTEAIREHAETKLEKLTQFFDATQQITLTIAKEGSHGHDTFEVEVMVEVERHETIVARVLGEDLYKIIEQACQKAARQLKDLKEKLKPGHHR